MASRGLGALALLCASAHALRAPVVGRRGALAGALATTLAPRLEPAAAWCGEAFPPWAYYLKWDELAVPFEWEGAKGQAYCRVVGDVAREVKAGVPPVLLIGTPGVGYDYLENMEALTVSDRRVIEVVFAGTAAGDAAPASLTSADACAAQLRAICATLRLPAVHVVAHGGGAPAALRLVGDPALPAVSRPGKDCASYATEKARAYCEKEAGAPAPPALSVRSLTLVSPYGALADLRPYARAALGGARPRAALLPTWYDAAAKSCVAEAASGPASVPALAPLLSGSDAEQLRGGALARALAKAGAPPSTLVATGGAADIVDDAGWVESLPGSVKYAKFDAGHLPFVEDRDRFLLTLLSFLDSADGVETNRELKFADPMETIKETKKGLAL